MYHYTHCTLCLTLYYALADPGGAQGARAPPFRSAKTFAPAYQMLSVACSRSPLGPRTKALRPMHTRICARGAVYASLVPRPFCGGGKGLPCKKWPGYEARYTHVINCEPMNPKCEGDYRCKQPAASITTFFSCTKAQSSGRTLSFG